MPIFNTKHHLHFMEYLGLDETVRQYRLTFGRLSDTQEVGARWQLLSESLLRCRDGIPGLRSEDTAYLMYCLYYTSARPAGFEIKDPCR